MLGKVETIGGILFERSAVVIEAFNESKLENESSKQKIEALERKAVNGKISSPEHN